MLNKYKTTIFKVYENLNNGLSWDNIEKTEYKDIEKKRKQNASISEFSKLIFKIRNNNQLLNLTKNTKEIDNNKEKNFIRYQTTYYTLKQYGCYYEYNIKDESINMVPFLKNYIIHKTSESKDLLYYY